MPAAHQHTAGSETREFSEEWLRFTASLCSYCCVPSGGSLTPPPRTVRLDHCTFAATSTSRPPCET
ncbi:hypothetical protein E2C01_001670 [Portunus trituberculatus]|uniref:Uncharacterized protein n=1 Tax=Portunus trituberculatus TaxID=210409 RepID=A0A5B7CIM8_PORTR|nr:hypothetical protein [Portunus trituberculatus]